MSSCLETDADLEYSISLVCTSMPLVNIKRALEGAVLMLNFSFFHKKTLTLQTGTRRQEMITSAL